MPLRKLTAAATLSAALVAGQAQAGNLAEPILSPEVIAEESSDTSGFIIPLVLLAIIAAIIAFGDGGGGGGTI
ncbi:MAG: hypothetical protein AAGO57_04740 [Pseudomonadota bacterium]